MHYVERSVRDKRNLLFLYVPLFSASTNLANLPISCGLDVVQPVERADESYQRSVERDKDIYLLCHGIFGEMCHGQTCYA